MMQYDGQYQRVFQSDEQEENIDAYNEHEAQEYDDKYAYQGVPWYYEYSRRSYVP